MATKAEARQELNEIQKDVSTDQCTVKKCGLT